MPRKFVIIGSQRTGTTWLRTLLDSHPLIDCYGEVLNLDDVTDQSYPKYVRQKGSRALLHRTRRGRLLFEYLDHLLFEKAEKATGFKLMYSMTSWYPYQFPMVMRYIEQRGLAVIHLTRANALRTHLSRVTARARNVWHTHKALGKKQAVVVPTDRLLKSLHKIVQQDELWKNKLSILDPLSITYESLARNLDDASGEILSFLDVDIEVGLQSTLKKINPNDLRQVIENYDEVENVMIGSIFETLLETES